MLEVGLWSFCHGSLIQTFDIRLNDTCSGFWHDRVVMLHSWSSFRAIACLSCLFAVAMSAAGATYQVSSISELNSRISSAAAGDTITVVNGVYTTTSSIAVTKVATAANPITIQAQTIGGVEIRGS